MAKKVTNIKTTFGTVVIGTSIQYAMHLQCTVSEGETNAFSALTKTLDVAADTAVEVINTMLIVDETGNVTESNSNAWFQGTEGAKYAIPSYLSQAFRDAVVKDMKTFKGVLATHLPISMDNHPVLMENSLIQLSIDELTDTGKSLYSALSLDKKLSSVVGLDDFIDRYAFKVHAHLTGPRGVGKSYKVTEYGRDHGAKVIQLNGHSGIEATDILGYNVRHSDGSFIWLDGPLSEAFRTAQTEPVILIVDEMLRIPKRELNIFIAALTPNASGEFLLNTSRIINVDPELGIGSAERLVVPQSNLWVIATSNQGSDYDTEDMDLAFNDRFVTYDMVEQEDVVTAILESNNINGLDNMYIVKLMNLYKSIQAQVLAQELSHTMNTRHLTRILNIVKDPLDIKSYLFDFAPYVCSRQTDGRLNQVELEIYKKTIKSIF